MVTIPYAHRNSSIHQQLRKKSLELMTNFDIHATLMDILKTLSLKELLDRGDVLYDIVVRLSPSNGLFSAFIRRSAYGLILGTGLSRLDKYGRQGNCLVGNILRPLCHCKGTTVP
ncbi:hypothetical protein GCK32_020843 [Trichostrongylus colubriformis]|uniref:Uncharacterized protein n=1 Tax=Trichostrongylus colubriformis TaxID=6319 RepID=A0AAN8EXQ0_TRICO